MSARGRQADEEILALEQNFLSAGIEVALVVKRWHPHRLMALDGLGPIVAGALLGSLSDLHESSPT